MFLTQQPIPKTIEDLGQEVTEDVLLARLEHQRALQEEAIRSYKADTLVVGAPKPSPAQSEDSEDDDDEDSYSQEYDDEEYDEEDEQQ